MKFRIEMELEVAEQDADVIKVVPDALRLRFAGTAVRINEILVEKVEDE